MSKQLWLNIGVKDPKKSLDFYTHVGLKAKSEFSSEVSETVVFSDGTLLMLVKDSFFTEVAKRDIADTSTHAEVILATQVDSKEEVDSMTVNAVEAGGTEIGEAFSHEGMCTRVFRDLDGHQFNMFTFVE